MFFSFLDLIRLKDWLKNFILLLPLIFSNNIKNFDKYDDLFIAFILFCLSSSFIYIINDIKDIEIDKLHPIKKEKKPLASNKITIYFAKLFSISVFIIILIFLFINQKYFYHISLYIIINLFYTFFAKEIFLLDLFILSFGYILRVDIGSIAIGVETSTFMFLTIFSLSFFVIALKRIGDLNINVKSEKNVYRNHTKLLNFIIVISALSTLSFYILYSVLINVKFLITIPLICLILFRYYKRSINTNEGEFPLDLFFKDIILLFLSLIYFAYAIFIYL